MLAIFLWRLETGIAAARERPVPKELDRVALAIYGAESSYGRNPLMWRPDLDGPQGPMQVAAAAARDVGGRDRFDFAKNRAMGRAYIARLYRRYGDWPDAIAAYNWGIGNVNGWISAGRPANQFPKNVAEYVSKVLRTSGLCALNSPGAHYCTTRPTLISQAEPGHHRRSRFSEVLQRVDHWVIKNWRRTALTQIGSP